MASDDQQPGTGGAVGHMGRPSFLPQPTQLRTIAVCQKCGRSSTMAKALEDEWLVARYRIDPGLWVIRCFGCITDWALRVSAAGRTAEWRDRMRRGRERAAREPEWFDPMSGPMSYLELPEEMTKVMLPDDSAIDYTDWVRLWRSVRQQGESK